MNKQKLAVALTHLQNAWKECAELFNDAGTDEAELNDFIAEEYPFEKSFSDYDVASWTETSLTKLRKDFVLFEYMYRDGANYKTRGEVLIEGELSEGQKDEIIDKLDGGESFIAEQVGITSLRPEEIGEDDHCWHEFVGFSNITAEEAAFRSVDYTVEEFVTAFQKVEFWDDVKYAI